MGDIIKVADFAKLHSIDCCVLDLRTSGEREREYLAESLHLPVQQLTREGFDQLVQEVDADKPVYLLCQSGRRAQMAIEKLGNCSRKLIIVDGGINGLKSLNHPLECGESKVLPLERQVRISVGLLVVSGVALGVWVNPGFYGLSAFAGAGLIFAGITDICPLAMVVARMPWNNGRGCGC